MGPVATARQRDRVEGYIAKGIAEGATEGLLPFLETKTVILEGNPAHIQE